MQKKTKEVVIGTFKCSHCGRSKSFVKGQEPEAKEVARRFRENGALCASCVAKGIEAPKPVVRAVGDDKVVFNVRCTEKGCNRSFASMTKGEAKASPKCKAHGGKFTPKPLPKKKVAKKVAANSKKEV